MGFVLFAVMVVSLGMGFTAGIIVRSRQWDLEAGDPRPVDMLLEQTRWLPILHVGHRWCDQQGYAVMPLAGQRVPIVVLEGCIRLIAEDRASNAAFLEHNGVRIGLPPEKRAWLGNVLKDRIAEWAMDDAGSKLLGP